jgi:hypothetical protein
MIDWGLDIPSVKRFDGLGAIGDVRLSSKLDGLAGFSAPLLLDPRILGKSERPRPTT